MQAFWDTYGDFVIFVAKILGGSLLLLVALLVIVAYLMMIVLIFITINLVVDILYTLLDPRVRLETKS